MTRKLNRRGFLKLGALLGLSACSASPAKQAATSKARVVVVGGGYGGATTARYIRLLDPGIRVTLVEPNPRILSCPGSNEVLAGWRKLDDLAIDYAHLRQNAEIEVVTAQAARIDNKNRVLALKDGGKLHYDRLVVAPGIDFRWDAIAGYDFAASQRVAHAWKAGPQTMLLRNQLRAMPDGGVVMLTVPAAPYRCPPGPYERASLIANYLQRCKPRSKIIILDAKTQFSKQALFFEGWKTLYPGMIEWLPSESEGLIEQVNVDTLTVTTHFNEHRADVLNVIPPQKAGSFAEENGLSDAGGWCPVDFDSFESTLLPRVHVIGDACIAYPMPKSAFSANSQAKICALAIVNLLNERTPSPPSLINHCYSFLAPDYAISITGVYARTTADKRLIATTTGETPMNADHAQEAHLAKNWQEHIRKDSFG
ncbi:NAD(P)/FAD-dependent oxidoreductase [Candidatus Methylospira mobilis]|uniref:NAD(P)/FAD-dependent oxidoreductase n=1 Tax=Candidatus Methylospira mobilis TaxID=1808979 RepID=UPI0028F10421|nr:NAD(P)/FAD-dependent oxidoreductase [Candidatus Methylospira mobilis]WNV04434.1 NAD(P)/FAD-dependent oxidoreductase [Candidatus Methylospira mobilis]